MCAMRTMDNYDMAIGDQQMTTPCNNPTQSPQTNHCYNTHRNRVMIRSTSPYFFPVFFPAFFEVFFDFFSSFFCIAFTEATFFTIFCSSIRKARRMLRSQSLSQTPTGHGRTCGTDCHHTHASPSAGKRGFFSCLSRRCGEATTHSAHASPTPARGFLQQPHFIGLTIFLLY